MKNILIHGLGQNETSWYMVSANLKKRNIDVEQPNLYLMIKDIKMDYDTLFQEFANYCNSYHEKLNLCGLSLGGILSLDYAKKFPDKVNSIILIGTPYKIPKLLFKLQGVIFYLMPEKAFKKMGYMKKDFMSLVKSMSNLDISGDLDKLQCRVLITCGVRDNPNMAYARQLNKKIKGSSLMSISNSGHEVNIENPDKLSTIIYDFWLNPY